MEWFFDGLGTELLSLIIGATAGSFIGYRIGVKKNKLSQTQHGGEGSKQEQKGKIGDKSKSISEGNAVSMDKSKLIQTQKAGDNATQIQKGKIENG